MLVDISVQLLLDVTDIGCPKLGLKIELWATWRTHG